jgi:hypothetical protein
MCNVEYLKEKFQHIPVRCGWCKLEMGRVLSQSLELVVSNFGNLLTEPSRHMKVVRLSAIRNGRLYPPKKYSWYSFLLEAESTPGPQCDRQDYANKKIH